MTDCPPDALTRKPNGEVVILDSCIGCGNCVHNCPYGVIQLVKDREEDDVPMLLQLFGIKSKKKKEAGPAKAAKCDLCQTIPSGPACVRSCPTGAALRVNPRDMVKALKEEIS
jgi:Fe-S-cluster-containing hydrogenase component 2